MFKQMLDILVILTSLKRCLIIDDNLDLSRITPMLLALALIDVNGLKDGICELKFVLFARLNQLVGICVH